MLIGHQPFCQKSKDANDRVHVPISLLPAVFDDFPAQTQVAIYLSLAIFIIFFHQLCMSVAAATLDCSQVFMPFHPTTSFECQLVAREHLFHRIVHAIFS